MEIMAKKTKLKGRFPLFQVGKLIRNAKECKLKNSKETQY